MSIVTIRVRPVPTPPQYTHTHPGRYPPNRTSNSSTTPRVSSTLTNSASHSSASHRSRTVNHVPSSLSPSLLHRAHVTSPLDLEWRLIYVSSPGNEELDQELDDCLVGPVPVGVNAFDFEGVPPDPSKIPLEDVFGVAALILTGSYKDQEFVRVGYYQNTEYDNEEMKETPPQKIMFDRLVRDMNTKPRVTRFQIKW